MSLSDQDSDLASVTSYMLTHSLSMELDPDTASKTRTYPSISDYYKANTHDPTRPTQLQHGLSNFSGLQFGDDRIAVAESILSGTYRLAVEDKMAILSPSKKKSKQSRKHGYTEALDKVGDVELDRLERVMKEKLFQRSYMTSSPFQVRKAFKFFDRECKMTIHIEGFTRALGFLGFQFSELQNIALFGRYDKDSSGEIDYMYFIGHAMFYGPNDNLPLVNRKPISRQAPKSPSAEDFNFVPDFDDQELRKLQEKALRDLFNKVDKNKKGCLNKQQLELLLMAMGVKASIQQLDQYYTEMSYDLNVGVYFEVFCDWWMMGEIDNRPVVQSKSPVHK